MNIENVSRPYAPGFTRSFSIKIALVVFGLMLIGNVALVYIGQYYGRQVARETTQSMHLGMAQYILSHQPRPLIADDGSISADNKALMQDLMMHVMAINPAVEVYLLNAQGNILGHVLEGMPPDALLGDKVDVEAVRALLSDSQNQSGRGALRLPVLGEDPRRQTVSNIVSVARISASDRQSTLGYLYIVLDGKAKQTIAADLQSSVALQELWLGMLISSVLVGFFLWLIIRKLTQPLNALTQRVRLWHLEEKDLPLQEQTIPAKQYDEIAMLSDAISALQHRVAEQFKRIEEADKMRRELVSNISHDLRTPLASIQGYVETVLIQGEKLTDAQRHSYLKVAHKHIQRLEKRVLELFELSKLDSGRVLPKQEVFCMAELLQDVVQGYQLQADRVKVRLVLNAQQHVQVLADIALIERVLQNLIENALRYTPNDGEVSVQLEVSGTHVAVHVIDTGIGIAEAHLPYIFERYWRANEGEVSNVSGSGLGLAIVKRILDLHGTVIRVKSELSAGTHFSFDLPKFRKDERFVIVS